MYRVYGDVISGNCYKIKLLLTQLEEPFEWVPISVVDKETKTPEYLAKNPNGRVPLLEIPGPSYLPESNAILHFLAQGSEYLPTDRLLHSQVIQWMFFEQYSHEPFIATSRFIVKYLGAPPAMQSKLEEKREPGYAALGVMEQHLIKQDFFVGERYSIADIALFAYTHMASEGGFSLSDFPAIRAWISRVGEQPRFIPIG